MPFDVEAFIRETGAEGQDAEDFRRLFGKNPKAQGLVLRQADYDRAMNDGKAKLSALEADLAQKRADVEAEYNALTTWKTGAETDLKAAKAAELAAANRVTSLRAALEKAATDAGRSLAEYYRDEAAAAAGGDERRGAGGGGGDERRVRDPETGQFVSLEQFANATIAQTRNTEKLFHIGNMHRELFGTSLPIDADLTGELLAAVKRGESAATLEGVWERKFKVGEKREELRKAAVEKEINDRVTARLQEERSAAALRGTTGYGDEEPQSPVLRDAAARAAARVKDGNPGGVGNPLAPAVAMFDKLLRQGRNAA